MDYLAAKAKIEKENPWALVVGVTFYRDLYIFGVADKDEKPDPKFGYWCSEIAYNKNTGKEIDNFNSNWYFKGKDKEYEEFEKSKHISFVD